MTTKFKSRSLPVLLAVASLVTFIAFGPMLWVASFASISPAPPAWSGSVLTLGFAGCTLAYVLFVSATIATLTVMLKRLWRARRMRSCVSAFSSR